MSHARRLAGRAAALVCGVLAAAAVSAVWAAPESSPAWTNLTAAQRQALSPLQRDWSSLDANRKQKWLQGARAHGRVGAHDTGRTRQRPLAVSASPSGAGRRTPGAVAGLPGTAGRRTCCAGAGAASAQGRQACGPFSRCHRCYWRSRSHSQPGFGSNGQGHSHRSRPAAVASAGRQAQYRLGHSGAASGAHRVAYGDAGPPGCNNHHDVHARGTARTSPAWFAQGGGDAELRRSHDDAPQARPPGRGHALGRAGRRLRIGWRAARTPLRAGPIRASSNRLQPMSRRRR
jgi:hypothetical protein